MENKSAIPSLPYATPGAKPRRKRPSLPAPIAAVVIICGTLLIATPVVVACVMHGQTQHSIPDAFVGLLFLTGAAGLFIVVIGILLAAFHRPARGN